jgi:hypothetical protein
MYTENTLAYVIDQFSKKYICEKILSEPEEEPDPANFFQAIRQQIININYSKSFKPLEKVKLLTEIASPGINRSVILSSETVPAFRKWMIDA